MNLLKLADKGIEKIVNSLVTVAMILILFIVFFQVLARFYHFSIGGFEEFPTYMMIVCTWLTAAMHVKRKGHISLNLFALFIKDLKTTKIINIITTLITAIAFAIFSILALDVIRYNLEMDYTTAGLKMPYWILMGLMMFSTIIMTIYYTKDIIVGIKEVIAWK
ncbi:TRAP transporter small permease subunit [Alkalibaculum sp. M08DMB]|uniref:TRAP transporter small permease subunit n=1 Tax=Alkalibaculum sporogenes TaxID=2655001 RepID=A0A6A7K4E4_9FIRM|nr:TRAP transporter small permease subunit [Alkalibaculum sporogenes]MPW24241.1 TRAP transporter small permease subunit [Alkalibaculum sporogenes]